MKTRIRYDIQRKKWRYVCACEPCRRRKSMVNGYSRMLKVFP